MTSHLSSWKEFCQRGHCLRALNKMLLQLLILSAILGVASFGFGSLPLSFTYSSALQVFLAFNSHLWLSREPAGTAICIVNRSSTWSCSRRDYSRVCLHVAEPRYKLATDFTRGIEAVLDGASDGKLPTSSIALSLLCGFTLMLVIEQLVSPHSHSHALNDLPLHSTEPRQSKRPAELEFDTELGDLEHVHEPSGTSRPGFREVDSTLSLESPADRQRAFPLTFGLTIHALSDGLALGVSSLAEAKVGEASSLSIIVFLALIIHKGE